MWRGNRPATHQTKEQGFTQIKFVLPLLPVLPDEPGTPTSGNPISYYNGTRWNFTWQKGRQLATASSEDREISYVYDLNGLRTEKTVVYVDGGEQEHTHEYTTSVTEPTCTTAGYTTYTCQCGESYVDNLVDALGHNYVLIEQNVSDGKIYRCTRCGATYTEGGIGINPPIDPDPPVNSRERNGNTTLVTEHHEYIYASGKLLREVITTTANGNTTTQTLDFTYDGSGYPYALTYANGTATPVTYYYITNLQGDVLYLVDDDGTAVATYTYDIWGKVISATGDMAEINPLRYRGYCYDNDTHFYYLQSRFYDPEIRRFVNADGYASTGQGFLGENMFAYCANNPINYTDATGFVIGRAFTVVMDDLGSLSEPEDNESPEKKPLPDVMPGNYITYPDEDLTGINKDVYENVNQEQAMELYRAISADDYYAQSIVSIPGMPDIISFFCDFFGMVEELSSDIPRDPNGRILYIEEGYSIIRITRVYSGGGYGSYYSYCEEEYFVFDENNDLTYNDVVKISYFCG